MTDALLMIPAKGKSLGLPGKNLHPLAGKPSINSECRLCHHPLTDEQTVYCSRVCRLNGLRIFQKGKPVGRAGEKYDKACEWCGTNMQLTPYLVQWQRFCSQSCFASWRVRQRRGITGIERLLAVALSRAGLRYDRNAPLGKFTVDFLLRDAAVAIEADGSYWHSLPRRRQADTEKDILAASVGITLLRFTEEAIRQDASLCVRAVISLAGEHVVGDPLLPLLDALPRRCSVSGCGREHCALGYCEAHYRRLHKHGRLTTVKQSMGRYTHCQAKECMRPPRTKGFCNMHYQRLRVHNTVDWPSNYKLKQEQVAAIRALRASGLSHGVIARQYMVSRSNIGLILTGRTWRRP